MDPREPGLFRKTIDGSVYLLSVYVDDTLVWGPNKKMVNQIISEILTKFKGKVIKPNICLKTGNEISDLLGCTLIYNGPKNFFKIHM